MSNELKFTKELSSQLSMIRDALLELDAALSDSVRMLNDHNKATEASTTSPMPLQTGANPLSPDITLRDQLEYTPKREPVGGAGAADAVAAARAEGAELKRARLQESNLE
ncbi:unnamed protein product [marine sediment metagenome]|uniref:Uncharacterized protein n=1 Tax=marine sediment metagenome TaxID=412755 RepID=X1BD94_9ZZZZ